MPEAHDVLTVVGEWVAKAENDLENAVRVLRKAEGCPTDTVCFHAEQCVEKYLKAFLVFQGTEFPKTHDIRFLGSRLPARARPKLTVEEQVLLTTYATAVRYPGAGEISLAEARQAVKLARRLRAAVRRQLPRAILRRGTR